MGKPELEVELTAGGHLGIIRVIPCMYPAFPPFMRVDRRSSTRPVLGWHGGRHRMTMEVNRHVSSALLILIIIIMTV